MKFLIVSMILMVGLSFINVQAQKGGAWQRTPSIAVISKDGDSRLDLVDDAVAFWNKTLAEIGSGFRLASAKRYRTAIQEEDLQALSLSIVGPQGAVLVGRRSVIEFPKSLRGLPGDLSIVLGESEFVSVASPFDSDGKQVIAIRGPKFPPMTMPNVTRNVIMHEIGHAIGLRHNSDPAALMCGRPSTCRPSLFSSSEPKLFPVTADEKRQLLLLYPADWKSKV